MLRMLVANPYKQFVQILVAYITVPFASPALAYKDNILVWRNISALFVIFAFHIVPYLVAVTPVLIGKEEAVHSIENLLVV